MEQTILQILRYIVTISDVILFVVIAYFTQGLRWSEEGDRPSIIGFAWMMVTIAASGAFAWI